MRVPPTLLVDAVAGLRADPSVVRVDWKTRGHDLAPGLHEALCEHGFEPDLPESIMIGEARALLVDRALPAGAASAERSCRCERSLHCVPA